MKIIKEKHPVALSSRILPKIDETQQAKKASKINILILA